MLYLPKADPPRAQEFRTWKCLFCPSRNIKARIGAISELHSFNTLGLIPSGPDALFILKPFNKLKTPFGSTVILPMEVNGLVPLQGITESDSRVKAD